MNVWKSWLGRKYDEEELVNSEWPTNIQYKLEADSKLVQKIIYL